MSGQHLRHAMTFSLLVIAFLVTAIFIQQNYIATAIPQPYRSENDTFGVISSIQYDDSGKPAWIVTGNWKSNLLDDLSSNASQAAANITSPFAGSPFSTQVEMVRLDGTAGHTHTITNFILATASRPDNMTKVLNGTSTASMMEGPVTDIPTTITFTNGKVISIWLDPSRIDNHYGNTPIYGIVIDDYRRQQSPLQR
jgi:hypothetical protein